MNVDLDLDAIAPQPRKIKLGGRILTCYPLNVYQLINVIRLQDKFVTSITAGEMEKAIRDAFEPLIPELKTDKTITFHMNQMRRLIQFAQEISVPEPDEDKTKYEDPKKKVALAKESPDSSGSTPDIPQDQPSGNTQ